MLRLLIGTGILLMIVGFGAAGWQYWQGLPGADTAVETVAMPAAAPARQSWLIAPDGGLVPQDVVRTYLAQEGFAPGRMVEVIRTRGLADLLVEGEKLPEAPFLQVLADIRAPRVADGLCGVLLRSFAEACALASARVVEDSVDPVAGTAVFRLELAYRLPSDEADLPDLAAHVLGTETVSLSLGAGEPGTESAEAALSAAVAAAQAACADRDARLLCRPMRLWLTWVPGGQASFRAEIAWLEPLPDGMYPAPPLDPESNG
jgi:hypothetical protein